MKTGRMTKFAGGVALVLTLVAGCSREEADNAAAPASRHKIVAREPSGSNVVTPGRLPSSSVMPNAGTSAPAEVADLHTVSALFCTVTERLELLALREEVLQEEARAEEERRCRDAAEERRLQSVFEQYSNRWEDIPDEHDRFMVARMIPDLARAERILRSLMESSDRAVVADVARYLRFFYEGRLNRPDEALAILLDGERRVLAGQEWPACLIAMSAREGKSLAALYHALAVTQFMRGKAEDAARAFARSAESASFDPRLSAYRYITLARAFENMCDKENALRAYHEAELQLLKITKKTEKAILLDCWDDIQESKTRLIKGVFKSFAWYH